MKKIFFSFIILASAKLNAQFCFNSPVNYSNPGTATNAFGVCTADFNGDGNLDLATCNDNSNNITIFFGDGSGVMNLSGVYPTAGMPHCIIAADFNGDNKPDLAIANFSPSVFSVHLNDGLGGFSAMSTFPAPSNTKSIVSTDFNNDGKLDVAVICPGASNFRAYLGDGTGNFNASFTSGTTSNPYSLCTADFNNDGFKDVATLSFSTGTIQVFMGLGNGTFSGPTGISGPANQYVIVTTDFNMDGNIDLAVGGGGSIIDFYTGDGTGSFVVGPNAPTAQQPRSIAFGDFDNDGDDDLVTANYSGQNVTILAQTGGGYSGGFPNIFLGGSPRWATVGDFNNDGLDDIAVTNNGMNLVHVLINNLPQPQISGNNPICAGESTQLIISGVDTVVAGLGVGSLTVLVSPGATTVYTLTAQNTGCNIQVQHSYTLTVNPLPNVTANATATLVCPGSPVIFTGGGANTYTWTGGVVDGIPFNTTGSQTFTVTGTDINNCTNSAGISISTPTPQPPAICQTTVDSLSLNNVIIWDKTLFQNADTFFVYRDTANNNYALIAAIPYGSLSQYSDTARSIGAVNGDPNITTYRYKMAYRDSCGTMSALSPYHNTIYNYNISSLFLWNQYEIEGQSTPVAGLSNYVLKRDNVGQTGNYVTAATAGASSTSINDPQYATYQTQADWRVETIWNITCTPTTRMGEQMMGTIVKSKSNITNNRTTDIVKILNQLINVYPNPSQGNINLHFNSNVTGKVVVKVYSPLGNEVYSNALVNPRGDVAIDLSNYQNGIYLLQMITDAGTISKRVIKN